MKKTIKLMSGVLALAMCFSVMPMSAFAEGESNVQYIDTGDTPEAVEVEISVVSEYSVQIPKKLTIEGVAATTDAVIPYTYKVKGSIAGNEQLSVVPDATVTMMQEGKENNVGTITQEKQVWSCADFETLNGANAFDTMISDPQDGKIHVKTMSAGVWNGTFNFNIALEEVVELISFTIDGTSYQAKEGMTWRTWFNEHSAEFPDASMDDEYNRIYGTDSYIFMNSGTMVKPDDLIVAGEYIFFDM